MINRSINILIICDLKPKLFILEEKYFFKNYKMHLAYIILLLIQKYHFLILDFLTRLCLPNSFRHSADRSLK